MRKGYWIALGILLVAATSYTLLVTTLGLHKRISTSVLDLVPKEQRDPELELARTLVQSEQNRVLLIALQSGGAEQPISPQQRNAFIESLRASGVFSDVFDIAGEETVKASAALLFDLRGELLLPTWLAQQSQQFAAHKSALDLENTKGATTPEATENPPLANKAQTALGESAAPASFADYLATTTVARLDTFLDTAEALAYQQLIPRDPQLLMLDAFNQWRTQNASLLRQPPPDRLLVWAKLNASPFTAAGQQPAFDALDNALHAASEQAGASEWTLQSSGVGRFAAANERGIRNEVAFFNIASIGAVLLICALMLRSPSVIFHTAALLSLSLPFAWLVTLLSFDSVPVIALVVGSVLVGVTIDYCMHVFLDSKGEVNTQLLRPLLLSCGTTAAAFLALIFSPLPLLAQTGVFVATGLVTTCALALLYRRLLGHHIRAHIRTHDIALARALPWKLPAALVLLLLAVGISRIEWNDSVDNLQYDLPELRAEDAAVRALFSAGNPSVFLTSGTTFAQARKALAAFEQSLPEGSQMTNLSAWLPLPENYLKTHTFFADNPDFAAKLRAALEAGGYDTESFEPFFTDLAHWQQLPFNAAGYEALFTNLQKELSGPAGNLIGSTPQTTFFISTGTIPDTHFTPTQGTVKVDTLYSLSGIFARYRHNALELSLWGALVIVAGSLGVYGLRRGLVMLSVPTVAGLATLGTVGYLQGQLNLFHLIGLFLGVCLALDYGAFALRGKGLASVPYSVCVAAATTISSFLLLTLSQVPAVVALGSTVALCVAYGFCFSLLLTIPQRRKPAPTTEPPAA